MEGQSQRICPNLHVSCGTGLYFKRDNPYSGGSPRFSSIQKPIGKVEMFWTWAVGNWALPFFKVSRNLWVNWPYTCIYLQTEKALYCVKITVGNQCNGNGCPSQIMDPGPGLCIPTVLPYRSLSAENWKSIALRCSKHNLGIPYYSKCQYTSQACYPWMR